jgi:uncharacterized membrane protein
MMAERVEPARGGTAAHAIRDLLTPAPATCFVGALATDLAYVATANMQWANFSAWLITVGLIVAAFAVIAGLADAVGAQGSRPSLVRLVGYAAALALSIVNAFVHSRDAYTSVVPTGLALSALVVAVLAATEWIDRRATARRAPTSAAGVRS